MVRMTIDEFMVADLPEGKSESFVVRSA